jgi:hypothetical protein
MPPEEDLMLYVGHTLYDSLMYKSIKEDLGFSYLLLW